MEAPKNSHSHVSTYLLIKFIDNAFCPFQMQVPNFSRAVDICQFNTHLAYQQAVVFIAPLYTIAIYIIGLFRKSKIILSSEGTRIFSFFEIMVVLFLPSYF